jgi:hypothetical protein
MEKRHPLQQMLLGKMVISLQKLKLDLCLSPCTSVNSKWTKDLNIRPETEVSTEKNREYSGSSIVGLCKYLTSSIEPQQLSNLEKGWTKGTS